MSFVYILGLCLFSTLVSAEELTIGRDKKASYPQPQQQPQQPGQRVPSTYQKQEYSHKPKKRCYQCAYSPPKTIHSKKTVHGSHQGLSGQNYEQSQYAYVSHTLHGGWDKCLGPFDHYQAKTYGVDTWDCQSGNCYVRRDPNGDVFRGCFKGEYGVDQHRYGCHIQGGSTYCFCEGELCNNGAAPHSKH